MDINLHEMHPIFMRAIGPLLNKAIHGTSESVHGNKILMWNNVSFPTTSAKFTLVVGQLSLGIREPVQNPDVFNFAIKEAIRYLGPIAKKLYYTFRNGISLEILIYTEGANEAVLSIPLKDDSFSIRLPDSKLSVVDPRAELFKLRVVRFTNWKTYVALKLAFIEEYPYVVFLETVLEGHYHVRLMDPQLNSQFIEAAKRVYLLQGLVQIIEPST